MKKFLALVLAVVMVAAMFTGCGAKEKADPKVLKIGMSGPLTGGAAVYGTAVEAGMKIAVEEINAAAGENGLKIEFNSQDDEHDSEIEQVILPVRTVGNIVKAHDIVGRSKTCVTLCVTDSPVCP